MPVIPVFVASENPVFRQILAEREIRTLGTFNSSHDFQVEKTWISGLYSPASLCT